MKQINLKYAYFFSLIFIVLTSFYLGATYTFYNQDFHHWSFILSMFTDYNNGFRLYKDIFLSYGPGQTIFFNLVNYFIKIDIVSIGIITNFIYAINFIILYKIFLRIVSKKISIILTFIIFLIHPYSILPWPDYLSGFCINIFIYLFLKSNKEEQSSIILASFLFLSFFFRNTYIVNIALAIFGYLILNFIFVKKNLYNKIFNLFLIQTLIYFLILWHYDNLYNFFSHSFSLLITFADNTNRIDTREEIIKNYGESIWIVLRLIYFVIRSFFGLINLSILSNLIFIIFIFFNILLVFTLKKKEYLNNPLEQKIIFISFLGLCGFTQSFYHFENFRIINSSIGIFVAGLYLLKKNTITRTDKNINFIISFVVISLLTINFFKDFTSNIFQYLKSNQNTYLLINNNFFGNKKINKESAKYYTELGNILCKKNLEIINFSPDIALTYLCDNKNNHQRIYVNDPVNDNKESYYKNTFRSGHINKDYKEIVIEKKIPKEKIIITFREMKFINDENIILNKFVTGHNKKFWQLPVQIFIYQKQ